MAEKKTPVKQLEDEFKAHHHNLAKGADSRQCKKSQRVFRQV